MLLVSGRGRRRGMLRFSRSQVLFQVRQKVVEECSRAWLCSGVGARCMLGVVGAVVGQTLLSSLNSTGVHVKAIGAWSWSRSAGTEEGLMEEGMVVRCGKPRLTEGVRWV